MKSSKKNVVFLVPKRRNVRKGNFFELFLEFESKWQRLMNESIGSTEEAFLRYVDRKVDDLKKDLVYVRDLKIEVE